MIKKAVTIISMFVLTTALIWAMWEGNAAAGSKDEFPAGLFAYSTVFPKHTLIEIINLENNMRSRAVVIGNMGTEGLLVKISPDLASALLVRVGNTVRVRVSLPAHVEEKGADPVLFSKNPEVKKEPVLSAAEYSEKNVNESLPIPPNPAEEPNRKETEFFYRVPEVTEPHHLESEEEKGVFPPVAAVDPPEEVPADRENDAFSYTVPGIAEPLPPQLNSSGEPPAPVITVDSVKEAPALGEDYTAAVPDVETPAEPEPVSPSEGRLFSDAPVLLEEPEDKEPELYDSYDGIPEYLATGEPRSEPAVFESFAEPAPDVPAAPAAEDEPEADIQEAVKKDEAKEYLPAPRRGSAALPSEQTVVLIPVGPKEPVGEVPPPKKKEIEKTAEPLALAPQQEKTPAAQPAAETYTTGTLKKGLFYVQIGRFTDSLNVESFIHRYGKQYPVAVEKNQGPRETFYRVYIGPLQRDERGAALETFQKLGFKDAFLKKAP